MNSRSASPRPIRVVFCWTDVSGYMAACWRALAQRPGIDLHILHPELLLRANPFRQDAELMRGVSTENFNAGARDIDRVLLDAVTSKRPDVVVICGWLYWPYTKLVQSRELRHARIIVGMDSPWRGTLTQRLARFRLAGLIRRLDGMVTSGERSRQYARRLGVAEHRIRTGFYGFDYDAYSRVADGRSGKPGEWPRQFLYVGRYVPAKDLATLVAAYSEYRRSVTAPWGLTCCGWGDEVRFLKNVPGIVDAGFTPPSQLPEVFSRHGAFVLPSQFEPWGVVVAEASAAGLPVICTTACGAGDDVVRDYYSGITVATGDVSGLARAMRWAHDHEDQLHLMGQRARGMSAAFAADSWATRWHEYFIHVLG
ncbi:MAG: glycosyltransferase family 4 protein [Acidobacteriota bacterium]|nr:glycosyltransferase family 4 protein [Acidobacteriota bacterium]